MVAATKRLLVRIWQALDSHQGKVSVVVQQPGAGNVGQHFGNPQITANRIRIRILRMMGRQTRLKHFQSAASAVLQSKQLRIAYHSRSNDRQTERTVSPQRLTPEENPVNLE